MLYQGRTTFNPVSVVAIGDPVDIPDFRVMYMPANHTVYVAVPGDIRQGIFKIGNELNSVFDLQF